MVLRLARTVRHLSPVQIGHRLRLRARAFAGQSWPEAAGRRAARRAGAVPPARAAAAPDRDLLRPCDPFLIEERAEAVAAGRFAFVGLERQLGARPFPAPTDVPLLWAYHLEYMDYLLDLAWSGHADVVERLVRQRLGTEDVPRLSATHPYPASRRTAAWARARAAGGGAARSALALGMWTWAHRVRANLERDVGGNHLLENGLALVLAGAAFRGGAARRLLETGSRILEAGVREQVLPDGGHYELSPHYHARVLSVLTEGGLAMSGAGRAPARDYWPAVARMASYLRDVLDPDGQIPLLGDSVREEELEPMRLFDAVASRVPERPPPPVRGDRLLGGSGLVVLEDREERHRLLLDAGPTCPPRLPAHGQADTFTFELHASGRPFVVDPGVYEYAAGPMRDWCRSTRAHSTVEVGGENSSEVWGSFRIGRRARIVDRRFALDRGRGTFVAEHDGYAHLGVRHRRLASHLDRGLWLVADRLIGAAGREVTARINLHPEAILERPADREFLVHLAGARLRVTAFGAFRASLEEGWHCPTFGLRRRTPVLRFDAAGAAGPFGVVLVAGPADPVAVAVEGDTIRVRRGSDRFTRALR